MVANKLDPKRERVSPSIITLDSSFAPLMNIADIPAEEASIGAVLQKPELYASLAETLQPGDFFSLKNGYIWHAFDTLANAGTGIDLMTVSTAMESLNAPIQGEELVRELSRMISKAPDTRNAETYAKTVFEAAVRIRILTATAEINKMVGDKSHSLDSVVDTCDNLLYKATNRRTESKTDAKSVMGAYFDKVEAQILTGAKSPGIPLGFQQMDDLTGGAYPGEVIVLAGGEGMGKTTWALSGGRNVIQAGKRVALFTLEMTQEEIIRIYTAMETGIYRSVLKSFALSSYQWGLFTKASGDIGKWPLEIIDEFPTLTPVQCRRKLRNLWQQSPIDLVIIDGLWLMEPNESERDRPRDVGNIMRDLNQIARDFSVPILITHQYNAEIRNMKQPTIYQLSESAGVRRNAQMVWGLHRSTDEETGADNTKLYLLKDRNGQTAGKVLPFNYDESHACYREAKNNV